MTIQLQKPFGHHDFDSFTNTRIIGLKVGGCTFFFCLVGPSSFGILNLYSWMGAEEQAPEGSRSFLWVWVCVEGTLGGCSECLAPPGLSGTLCGISNRHSKGFDGVPLSSCCPYTGWPRFRLVPV